MVTLNLSHAFAVLCDGLVMVQGAGLCSQLNTKGLISLLALLHFTKG